MADAEEESEGGEGDVRDGRRIGANVPNDSRNSHKKSSRNDGVKPPVTERDFAPLKVTRRIKPDNSF